MLSNRIICVISLSLLLAACQTLNNWGDTVRNSFKESSNTNCPPVKIMDELSTLTEFKRGNSSRNKISEITLDTARSSCEKNENHIVMAIELQMTANLGPKGRTQKNDLPSFAYPYFIAVADTSGKILAKEIFAVSVTYQRGQNSLLQTETIKQQIPYETPGVIPQYTILVGFQLNDEELSFNRTNS